MPDIETLIKLGPVGILSIAIVILSYNLYLKQKSKNNDPWKDRVERRLRDYHDLNQRLSEIQLELHLLRSQANRLESEFRQHMIENGKFREEFGQFKAHIENIQQMQQMIWEKLNG